MGDITELRKAILELSKRVEKIERTLYFQDNTIIRPPALKPKPKIRPFFVKGHDMPIIPLGPTNPIRGRFLTLKVLYDENKAMFVEEICEKTGRSRALEVGYLNDLARNGWVEKESVKVGDKARIKYKITDVGKEVLKSLLT
jgi:hypothetical protein